MPTRVLLVQTSFLGDVVLTTALAEAIGAAWPAAEIWWVVRPDAVPLLVPTFGAERVIGFDKRGRDRGLVGVLRLGRRLAAIGFDAAVGVQRSLRTAVLLAWTRIPLRVGYAGSAGAWLYHRRVPRTGAHARDRLVALAAGLGIDVAAPPAPRLDVDADAARRVSDRLASSAVAEDQGLIVVAPGSAWATKRWPAARFGQAAAEISRPGRDRIVVLGAPADVPLAREVGEAVAARGGGEVLDVTGSSSIADAVAWIARARLVLANDSAPAHLAAALGRPVVALFGPTVPAQGFAPLGDRVAIVERDGLGCRPCSRHGGDVCPIGTHECLEELPAARVVEACRRLLDATSRAPGGTA